VSFALQTLKPLMVMNSKTKLILALGGLLAIVGLSAGWLMYNQPHADLNEMEAAHRLPAAELYSAFEADEAAANARFLDQVVAVTGEVADVTEAQDGTLIVMLREPAGMFGVSCAFQPEQAAPAKSLQPGQTVTIKGQCSGMLMDVNLTRCVVSE
jgi:hypothetical protein